MTRERLTTEAVAVGRHMTARAIAVFGLGVVLTFGACQTDREITSPEPVPVTDKLVASAVLTVEDLPDGWVETAEPAPINTDVIADHGCDDKLSDLDPKESASVGFDLGEVHLSNSVAYFPGDGGAVEDLIHDIAEDCKQVVLADQGLAIRTLGLDFGVLSDNTLPIRFEFEPDVGPISETDLILIRKGDLVSIVRLEGLRPSDKALLDTAVRVSIGRLGTIDAQI